MQFPVIQLRSYSQYQQSSCHRCHVPAGPYKRYIKTGTVSPTTYSNLTNYGWLDYDSYFYKKGTQPSCCRDYTTRIDITKYRIRRSHQKIIRRWNQFLSEDQKLITQEPEQQQLEGVLEFKESSTEFISIDGNLETGIEANKPKKLQEKTEMIIRDCINDLAKYLKMNSAETSTKLGWKDENEGLYIADEIEKKARLTKRDTKKYRLFTSDILNVLFQNNAEKLQQQKIINHIGDFISRVRTLVIDRIKEFEELLSGVKFDIQENGQITFMFSKEDSSLKSTALDPNQGKRLEIKMIKAQFEEESYQLYEKFQDKIHQKTTSRPSYTSFLCTQNIRDGQIKSAGKTLNLGCYHMKYYLDEKLIAVAVLQISPEMMVSAQFFYEPEYRNLSIAIIGAQIELKHMQEMQKFFPNFRYYSLGYYTPTNKKMLYKASYEPMEVLCPKTYRWMNFDEETKAKVHKLETTLSSEKVIEDMDFSEVDMDEFIKKIVVLKSDMVTNYDFTADQQVLSASDFKDVVKDLGKRISKSSAFIIY